LVVVQSDAVELLRLRQADSPLSPARAIALAQRIHYHRVTLRHREIEGVTKLTPEQKALFDQLGVERPTTETVKAAAKCNFPGPDNLRSITYSANYRTSRVTNMGDHSPQQIVERYKSLADIERGYRVMKSEIEIAPVYYRKADRIRAHALICFLALVLYRMLRMRLKDRHSPYSPERALEIVRRIQFHRVTLHQNQTASGLTTLTPEQRDLSDAIDRRKPPHRL